MDAILSPNAATGDYYCENAASRHSSPFLFLFHLFNYISLPNIYSTYTQTVRAQIKAVHGNQLLSAVKAKCPGTCPDPLILSQALGREPDKAGRKGVHNKREE